MPQQHGGLRGGWGAVFCALPVIMTKTCILTTSALTQSTARPELEPGGCVSQNMGRNPLAAVINPKPWAHFALIGFEDPPALRGRA